MRERTQRVIDFALFIYFGVIGMFTFIKMLNSEIDIFIMIFIFIILMLSGRCLDDFIINISKELKE